MIIAMHITNRKSILNIVLFLIITVAILALNNYPNFYASQHTPPLFRYSGQASWFDPWDLNVYVSAIRSGSRSGLLFINNYTTTPHSPILVFPLYTIVGSLFSSLNPFLLFHALATINGLFLIIGMFCIIKLFLNNTKLSLVALFLVCTGGGLGWMFFPTIESSDLFMTGFTFHSQFQRGHEGFGILLYLLSLVLSYQGIRTKTFIPLIFSLLTSCLLVVFYPYYLISIALICGVFALRKISQSQEYLPYTVVFIINLFVTGFITLIYRSHLFSNPGLTEILSQHLITPNIISLILGYGLLLPTLFIVLPKWRDSDQNYFLTSWLILSLVLAYLPFGFSRFFLRTLFLPIILLIFHNLEYLNKVTAISKRTIVLCLLFVIPISTFFILSKRLSEVSKNNPWYYLNPQQTQTLDFLTQNTPPGSGVLSAYTFGNLLPVHTQNKAYYGLSFQTTTLVPSLQNTLAFYSQQFTENEAKSFLQQSNISYVIFGSEERAITNQYAHTSTLQYSFLQKVFESQGITVYSFH